MNIDEIKRNLNRRKASGGARNLEPSVDSLYGHSLGSRSDAPQPVQKPFVIDADKNNNHNKGRLANKVFDPDEEEEDIVPNSKSWDVEDDKNVDPLGSVTRFIGELDLDNPEYDWRDRTKKGRTSRKRFTQYLAGVL